MLHEFITTHRDEIIRRCRERGTTRPQSTRTEVEADSRVPLFLDQVVNTLRLRGHPSFDVGTGSARHRPDPLLDRFAVPPVVHEYGDVCQTVIELALETNAPVDTGEIRTLNRCLGEAIAGAVTGDTREREQSTLDRRTVARGNQQMEFLAHELRNLVNTAIVAFGALKTGNVGIGGSTGAVLERSLTNLQELIARSLDEVRLGAGIQNLEQISVAEFIAELTDAAVLDASARGRTLAVAPVETAWTIEADRKVLAAVVVNLLQNGVKFSPAGSTVRLQVGASGDRVLIEVHDECGGFPGGEEFKEEFRPYEQRGADRTGAGIGLTFCRWGAKANNGRLYAHSLPGKGCVFTVDLPRSISAMARLF